MSASATQGGHNNVREKYKRYRPGASEAICLPPMTTSVLFGD